MAVHAHPDDESSKGAATMAKYVRDGEYVLVVSCTGGERGDVLNPKLQDDPHILRDMVQVRRDELAAAQAIVGFDHTWLGFVDSGLPEGDPLPPLPAGCFAAEPIEVTTEALVRVIREARPHVLVTYDETGGYPHPDHVNCHIVSMSAFAAAGDPDAYAHAGEPWQPLKLYYVQSSHRERIQRLYELMVERGIETDYGEWLKNWKRADREVTTRVPCAEYFDIRDRALLAHATQVDPDGSWFDTPRDLVREGWPTEDYELVVSYVAV
ncbi:MAG TPA: mycothiol conjugate amidase Mca, partial [Lapillicoccus sp.]|nr:mycothiol conjugate amidase Mca [Lapillicoccus sp.]